MPLSKITNPFLDPAGSASSNVYSPAANTIGIVTSGIDRVRVDPNGNMGVGTTTLTNKFNVAGAIQSSAILTAVEANTVAMSQESGYSRLAAFGPNSSTGGTLYLYSISTNGAVQNGAIIDSLGRMTTPSQPSFMAYRTNGAVSGTGVYICNTTTFNDGSHFNTTTGKFTAPVAGRYQCNFFVLCQNPNNIDVNIYVNNAMYAGMDFRCNNSAVNHNFTLSVSGILKLSANDTVNPQITSQPSGSLYGSGLNGFSMHFLG
jgi:hypothetical protein